MTNEQLAVSLAAINRSLVTAIQEARDLCKESGIGEERKNIFGGTSWQVDQLAPIESEQYQLELYIKTLSSSEDLTS